MEDPRIDLILENIVQLASGDFDLPNYEVEQQDSVDAIGLGLIMLAEHLTETVASRELLNKAVEEKNILLKEIHHRVKNNLQIITSLLGLQSASIGDAKTRDLFLQSQHRIQSIALVHEMLYHSDDLSGINYRDYLEQLTSALIRSMKSEFSHVEVSLHVPPIVLNISTAIPMGLILNELITNALKYGLDEDNQVSIYISLKETNPDMFELEFGDNGQGMTEEVLAKETLGLRLVSRLTKQLKGDIEHPTKDKGTHYLIRFSAIE